MSQGHEACHFASNLLCIDCIDCIDCMVRLLRSYSFQYIPYLGSFNFQLSMFIILQLGYDLLSALYSLLFVSLPFFPCCIIYGLQLSTKSLKRPILYNDPILGYSNCSKCAR